MNDYIVEFRNGSEVLEKRKFSTMDGRGGVDFYILMKSFGKNLDKEYNFLVKRKHGDWFKQYDNNGQIVSICGINPVELATNEALASITSKLADLLKQGKK